MNDGKVVLSARSWFFRGYTADFDSCSVLRRLVLAAGVMITTAPALGQEPGLTGLGTLNGGFAIWHWNLSRWFRCRGLQR